MPHDSKHNLAVDALPHLFFLTTFSQMIGFLMLAHDHAGTTHRLSSQISFRELTPFV